MDLLELEQSGVKMIRTRSLRIDEFSVRGDRQVNDERREQRIEAHRERTDAEERLRRWSYEVKIKAGWVCEAEGCGELDRRLLESHHIIPKDLYPQLMHKLSNGKCLCIRCHAEAHKNNPEIAEMILERLEKVA